MTHPTDAAIAQAFREWAKTSAFHAVVTGIEHRARELDAEKGGEAEFVADICGSCQQVFYTPHDCPHATPPAQAAEAVERVARAIYECEAVDTLGDFPWNHLVGSGAFPDTLTKYRRMARAAIAAMQAGE